MDGISVFKTPSETQGRGEGEVEEGEEADRLQVYRFSS